MTPAGRRVCRLLAEWLADVVALIPSPETRIPDYLDTWEESKEWGFVPTKRPSVVLSHHFMEEATSLPSCQRWIDAFAEEAGPKYGKIACAPTMSLVVAPHAILYNIWDRVRPWDEGRSRRLVKYCRLLDNTVFRDSVAYTMLWPLPGLRCADAPLRLSDKVSLDYMDTDEVIAGLSQHILYYGESLTFIERPICLRFRADVPIVIQDNFDGELSEPPSTEGILERFYQAWRLLSGEPLRHAGYLSHALVGPPAHIYGERRALSVEVYPLTELEDSAGLRTLWDAVGSPAVLDRLGIALRRFSTSVERDGVDDRLVDLLVASETLFLSDVDERTELSYRLSIRAAASSAFTDRMGAFRFFKAAYNVRSRLVHGEQPRAQDMRMPDGGRASDLAAFTDTVEDALRRALGEVVLALHGGETMPDWDALVLGVAEMNSAAAPTRRREQKR